MSLFKESGNDRFQRESQEMWNKISSEKTTTSTSSTELKRTYEERRTSNRNGNGLLDQSSRLLNGGPGLIEQTEDMIGKAGSRVGKIQRATLSNSYNGHIEDNIEEPFVAEVALPRNAPPSKPSQGPPSKSSHAPPSKLSQAPPSKPSPAIPSKPQSVDIFPRRKASKFVKSKPAIWEPEEPIKPLFAPGKERRNKQSNVQPKQTRVKCTKK